MSTSRFEVTIESPFGHETRFETEHEEQIEFRVRLYAKRHKWPREVLTVIIRRLAW